MAVVHEDKPFTRRFHDAAVFILAGADFFLHLQPLKLGGRAGGENLENGLLLGLGRHGLAVQYGQVAEDGACRVHERDSQIADRFQVPGVVVVRVKTQNVIRQVDQFA